MNTFKGIVGISILATSIGLTSCYSSRYGSHHHHGSHYGSHATGVGAFVGGVLGAVFGEVFQGYDGNLFGSTVGTLAGAAVGSEIAKGQEMRHQNKQSDAYFEQLDQENRAANERYTDLNTLGLGDVRFSDSNKDGTIDVMEDCTLSFVITNRGEATAYEVTPKIELLGGKGIVISPSITIDTIRSGASMVYTAHLRANKKLRTGEAIFRIKASDKNDNAAQSQIFVLPTRSKRDEK